MLTIFTIPKPFQGHIGIIQRNAIQSWLKLQPKCDIILFGDEEGIAETAAEFGVSHIPAIQKNEYGTPLLDDVFNHAQQLANHDFVCYVNADIILLREFISAIAQIHFKKFLMVGQRWDLNIEKSLDFEKDNWEESLYDDIHKNGNLHPPWGSDYFVFPKGILGQIPQFAVGRPGWDNWMIYHARKLGIPVIDCTPKIKAIHQNHNYSHIPDRTGEKFEGPEANLNRALMELKEEQYFMLQDANWILTSKGLRRPEWTRKRLDRSLETLQILHPHLSQFASIGLKVLRRIP